MSGGTLSAADWVALFVQFVGLSMVSISGAIATVPDMQRFLVVRHGWMTDPQFTASIAIAQAAPGPNVLFVALLGWQVGFNAGGGTAAAGALPWLLGAFGMAVTMVGILLPSSVLTYSAARWSARNTHRRSVRAFRQGMAPLVVGLLVSTGWVLANGTAAGADAEGWRGHVGILAVAGVSTLLVWRTRLHLLWLLAAGAAVGALGWV